MKWIHQLSANLDQPADVIGSKAFGLVTLLRLGLPVPPGFVIGADACREFLHKGQFPDGLEDELAAVETQAPVSVRSGSEVSMPGMMNTVLNVSGHLKEAIIKVFQSWNTPRARTYRALNDIPDDLGTAVTVQKMVFGNRDDHSGSGVAFSRNPNTGEPVPYGDVLFGHQGDAVVSGTHPTSPLTALTGEPAVWEGLLDGLRRIENHYRDACYVEFTFESGELWFLQVRPGRFVGRAAIRLAVDLVDEKTISQGEAVDRVSTRDVANANTPRIVATDVLARGTGASPGVAAGKIVTTSDEAANTPGPVILVRPETSPLDMHGLAAAAGVVTARGGPTSHAAVVARSMGKPAVVGVTDLSVEDAAINVNGQRIPAGTVISIDGTSGTVVAGHAEVETAADDEYLARFVGWAAIPPPIR
ncbi:pyruvate, phosphate dikinase [Kibdelosporangium philippinense]|uniref:Pyruvate, phosphate dikinase n=1 Tax=Kibdelosporangium philippinense TaxID=211113 RepID=A0ABS8ZGC8_9PSEU|nr:PEP/pyruvate-binding domain-containing protein [Kibdelosporangium philippinense]MCE7006339.1 pyruvate, phosphate dikinase [Kibdelosporangium philippinense]